MTNKWHIISLKVITIDSHYIAVEYSPNSLKYRDIENNTKWESQSTDHIMNPQKTLRPYGRATGRLFGIHWREDPAKAHCITTLHNEWKGEGCHNANSGASDVTGSYRETYGAKPVPWQLPALKAGKF